MAEPHQKKSTARIPTMLRNIQSMMGFTRPNHRIHNRSDKPMFLIPISCNDGLSLSDGMIRNDLAKIIPAGESIPVDSSEYDLNRTEDGAQIYIHFLVGRNDSDDVEKFLKNLPPKYLDNVDGKETFLHHHLDDLYLTCQDGKVVQEVKGDGNAGQELANPALPRERMVTEPDGGQQQQEDRALPKEGTVTGPNGGQQQQADPAMTKEETVTGPNGGQQAGTNRV